MKSNASTSNKVFLILDFILKNDVFSLDEIAVMLEKRNIYLEKETLNKYIRTLKKMGFSFKKLDNKIYKITSLPFCLRNIDLIFDIVHLLKEEPKYDFYKTLQKIALFLPEENQKDFSEKIEKMNNKIPQIEKYIREAQQLKIVVETQGKNDYKTVFEPYDIHYEVNENYIFGYDTLKKEITEYPLKKIISFKQTPTKNRFSFTKKEAIIKFSQRVAKSYVLKDDEIIVEKTPENLVVKTFFYDKKIFFKRILRYGNCCEIISTENLIEDFRRYLKDLYQMYDCNN